MLRCNTFTSAPSKCSQCMLYLDLVVLAIVLVLAILLPILSDWSNLLLILNLYLVALNGSWILNMCELRSLHLVRRIDHKLYKCFSHETHHFLYLAKHLMISFLYLLGYVCHGLLHDFLSVLQFINLFVIPIFLSKTFGITAKSYHSDPCCYQVNLTGHAKKYVWYFCKHQVNLFNVCGFAILIKIREKG